MEGGIEALASLRRLISPVVSGIESLPDPLVCGRPLLFVGNHTQFGLYDLPMLVRSISQILNPPVRSAPSIEIPISAGKRPMAAGTLRPVPGSAAGPVPLGIVGF